MKRGAVVLTWFRASVAAMTSIVPCQVKSKVLTAAEDPGDCTVAVDEGGGKELQWARA